MRSTTARLSVAMSLLEDFALVTKFSGVGGGVATLGLEVLAATSITA